jgi:CRISPR/Cas system CSM-associated protein Csm3 (group 7 of RAMP superfamily)
MITLTLTVQQSSPLHIGGESRLNTAASKPLLKDLDGFPYIPATSIKGRLRHEVERILRAISAVFICQPPTPETMCQPIDEMTVCPLCYLFGSPWQEAALWFTNLELTPGDREFIYKTRNPQTQTRYSVSIERKRRVQEQKRLFDIELFEPGIAWTFSGTATYRGTLVDLAPVLLAAKAVEALGSGRSRGYGWCSIDIACPDYDPKTLGDLYARWQEKWAHRQ